MYHNYVLKLRCDVAYMHMYIRNYNCNYELCSKISLYNVLANDIAVFISLCT